jgi:hypothetical protein
MGVFQNNLLAGAAAAASAGGGAFYDYQIEQSARFDKAAGSYMTADFDGNSGQTNYTISMWVKRGLLSTSDDQPLLGNSGGWANHAFTSSDTFRLTNQKYQTVDGVFRDTNGWTNIIVNQTSSQDTVNMWINGVSRTVTSSGSGNFYTPFTNVSSAKLRIGYNGSTRYFDGYMAEVVCVDGADKVHTDFGKFSNGIWIPIDYSGSYGTDGFRLTFSNASSLGEDSSGNGNDFTVTNMGADHQVLDSPTFGS